MQRFYPAVVEKESGSDYGVWFPDFPGCVSADADLETALLSAVEALQLHVDGLLDDGSPIPEPSRRFGDQGTCLALIPVLVSKKGRKGAA